MSTKIYKEINVYEAARERFRMVYREFDRVCVSFSNGKDSGVMLNMAIDAAREAGKLPVNALYIDMEAQYRHAIEFTQRMFSREEVTGWWVCLPIHLRNAVSQIQPYWIPWEQSKRDAWVREYPDNPHVIKDTSYFPFSSMVWSLRNLYQNLPNGSVKERKRLALWAYAQMRA